MTGKLLVNGKEGISIADIKKITGFVPQDDIVHENLTVQENLRFSARWRNPANLKHWELMNIVDDCLSILQLQHVQASIVGSVEQRGISGGQRKRVNIGLELAAS